MKHMSLKHNCLIGFLICMIIALSVLLCVNAGASSSEAIIGGADGPTEIVVSKGDNVEDTKKNSDENSENGAAKSGDEAKNEEETVQELSPMKRLYVYGAAQYIGESVRTPMRIALYILTALLAYALGSLNCGIIISKVFYHDDIRKYGSGNAGTTNMLRTYGKKAAIGTIVGDALKVVLAILIANLLVGAYYGGGHLAVLLAIIGHVYPVYYGFKGGKGVVASAVAILMLSPSVFAIVFAFFVVVVAIWKYISLGSILSAAIYPLVNYAAYGADLSTLFAFVIAVFVIFLHRTNIQRLIDGKENKLSFKKTDKKSVEASDSNKSNDGE